MIRTSDNKYWIVNILIIDTGHRYEAPVKPYFIVQYLNQVNIEIKPAVINICLPLLAMIVNAHTVDVLVRSYAPPN